MRVLSAGQYLLGVVSLVVVAGSLAVTAASVRRVMVPGWVGAPARLAEAVIGVTALVLAAELLGAAGVLERGPLVLLCALVAAAAFCALRAREPGARGGPQAVRAPAGVDRAALAAAALVVALALVPWMDHVLGALHTGIREYDSVYYHLPFAARFAQTGSITGLQYVANPPVSFYPANSELIHAVGMVLFGRDLLSPLLNVGWLGIALLAAWCIGRPFGASPAALAATALVASVQVMEGSQAGAAKNDIVALALLLAAVALFVSASEARGAVVLAALAGGLAVGTRLNLWAPVLALLAVWVVAARAPRRRAVAGWWIGGIVAGGGFWYLRNLIATGNPLPWFGLKLGGLLDLRATAPPTDCGTTSVAHYLAHPGFVGSRLVPQLVESFGRAWWLVLGLAGIGIAAGLASRSTPKLRALAFVGLVSAVAYLFTPATAGGIHARCFAFNTRFAIPAVVLGLIVLVLLLGSRRRVAPVISVLGLALVLIVDDKIPVAPKAILLAVVLAGGVSAVGLGAPRSLPRRLVVPAAAVLALAVVVGGWREARSYLSTRYRIPVLEEPLEPVAAVLAKVHGARIAVSGFSQTYPLYGADLSNRVDFPATRVDGTRFVAPESCRTWLTALERGGYGYVVAGQPGGQPSPAAAWTRRYPGARRIAASAPGAERRGVPWNWAVYRLTPESGIDIRAACAGP